MHSIAFRVTKEECLDLPEVTEEIRMVDLEPKAAPDPDRTRFELWRGIDTY